MSFTRPREFFYSPILLRSGVVIGHWMFPRLHFCTSCDHVTVFWGLIIGYMCAVRGMRFSLVTAFLAFYSFYIVLTFPAQACCSKALYTGWVGIGKSRSRQIPCLERSIFWLIHRCLFSMMLTEQTRKLLVPLSWDMNPIHSVTFIRILSWLCHLPNAPLPKW